MALLIQQMANSSQCRGRAGRLQLVKNTAGSVAIRYQAASGMVFFIEPRRHPYGEPGIWCKEAAALPASARTHTFGGGYVCLGHGLTSWDLRRILIYCDGWAKGYQTYRRTGRFPPNPASTLRG